MNTQIASANYVIERGAVSFFGQGKARSARGYPGLYEQQGQFQEPDFEEPSWAHHATQDLGNRSGMNRLNSHMYNRYL